MVQDLSNQKKASKESVFAAIQALKAKGHDINPYSVADEAKIPRSALYRTPEYMDMIAQERGETRGGDSEAQARIAELETRIVQLEEQVWDLEKQNEVLAMQKEEAFHRGFQAGHEDARQKGKDGVPAAAEPSAAQGDAGAETNFAPPDGSSESASPAPVPTEVAHEAAPLTLFAGVDAPAAATPPAAVSPSSNAASPSAAGAAGSSTASTGAGAPASSAAAASGSATAAAAGAGVEPASAELGADPRVTAAIAAQMQGDLFNAARSGPYVASAYNPLVELSWRDVEAVYNFSAGSLKEIAKNIGDAGHPGRQQTGELSQSAPQHEPSAADSEHSPPAAGSEQDEPQSKLNLKNAVPSWKDQLDWSAPEDEGQQAAPPESTGLPLRGRQVSTGENEPYESRAEEYSFSEPLSYDYYEQDGFLNPQERLVAPGQEQAPPAGAHGGFNDVATGDQMPPLAEVPEPSAVGAPANVERDPRDLSSSEPVVDLDALDIFDDLDDYADLDKINVIDDVNVPPPAEEAEEKNAGDELRELIKGRIKQAAEMPGGGDQGAVNVAGDKGAAAMGSRSKFVGGKAKESEQSSPTQQPAPGFVVRNVPPEIRKACMILGVRPEEMTKQSVIEAWKRQIATDGVHPDLGGDTEAAIYLNTAKDTLVRWLDQQAPKLGKKFGKGSQ